MIQLPKPFCIPNLDFYSMNYTVVKYKYKTVIKFLDFKTLPNNPCIHILLMCHVRKKITLKIAVTLSLPGDFGIFLFFKTHFFFNFLISISRMFP